MERRAAELPFLASFIILIHPLLPHWNDNFDTPSTTGLNKLLILNVLYAFVAIETRHATSLHLIKSLF